MKTGEIIARLLRPTDQQAPKPVHPAARALDNPTSSAKPLIFSDVLRFLPACPDMRSEARLLDPLAYLLIIVALVETWFLRTAWRGRWPIQLPSVRRTARTDSGSAQCVPLTPRTQYEQDVPGQRMMSASSAATWRPSRWMCQPSTKPWWACTENGSCRPSGLARKRPQASDGMSGVASDAIGC